MKIYVQYKCSFQRSPNSSTCLDIKYIFRYICPFQRSSNSSSCLDISVFFVDTSTQARIYASVLFVYLLKHKFKFKCKCSLCLVINLESIILQGTAVLDFSQSGVEVYNNWNAPKAVTLSAVIYCLRCMVGHDIPLNEVNNE